MTSSTASISPWRQLSVGIADTKHAYDACLLFDDLIHRISNDININSWYFPVQGICQLSLDWV